MRRDFTVNAIAVNLRTGRITAPDGAMDDVRDGVIRAISATSFDEDPLRLLRAAQFASRLEFTIEPVTFAQMREKAEAVRHCSPERIRDEVVKLIEKSARPSVGIALMRDSGLLTHTVPELLEGIGVVQNRHHKFDVWHHVMAALDHSAAAGDDLLTRMACPAARHRQAANGGSAPRRRGAARSTPTRRWERT